MPFLSRGIRGNPDGLAVDDGIHHWNYRELGGRANEVARRLRNLGLRAGETVAVMGRLDAHVLAVFHGVWRVGGVVAPIHGSWKKGELDRALDLFSPALIVSGRGAGEVRHGGRVHPALSVGDLGLDEGGRFNPSREVEPTVFASSRPPHEDVAVRLLTSGTTGSPRMVSLTVKNLLASAEGSRERLGLTHTDRWLGSLAPAHVGGIALISRAASLGSGVILAGPFRENTFLDLATGSSITHASLVPTMLHRLLNTWGDRPVPDTLKCLLIGGAPVHEGLVRKAVRSGFPLALTYGLTEAGSQVATAPPELAREKPGSVGPPLPGVRVKISQDGELLIRGDTVAPNELREDGWLHTGDLGRTDASGHLWITGRKSDRIISGGVNVDPREVERTLEAQEYVAEALVVGVADGEWGERVVAVVVPTTPGLLSEEELAAHVRECLSPPKRPKAFRILESFPRNTNGKVDRSRIRELFR